MSEFLESIAIKAPVETVYATITDFEHYPKIFPDVKAVEVLAHTKTHAEVTFRVEAMKTIHYTLDFKLHPPHDIAWSLVKGDLMKSNDGSWTLSSLGDNLTDATLKMEVQFSMWVPKSLGESALKSEMHKMLTYFKKAAEAKVAKGGKSTKKS
jgi:ribosome-associated toxin RatA of RatAB toxin-antitoxin module